MTKLNELRLYPEDRWFLVMSVRGQIVILAQVEVMEYLRLLDGGG
jgi:hypothetical protein